jgi:hypothetical protein
MRKLVVFRPGVPDTILRIDGAWDTACAECNQNASQLGCHLFGEKQERDQVGLRLRLPDCIEAERRGGERR